MSEQELIEGCCRGNRKVQQALYDRYCGKMYVVCLRYANGKQEAEDILQEAFIKVFDHIKNFRKESMLGTWIRRIVINTALNHKRNKLYLYPMVDIDHMHNAAGEEFIISNYHFQDLIKLVQSLPEGCRVIFNLFAIEGFPHKEIAQMIGISEGTSKSQYARARLLLQRKLVAIDSNRFEPGVKKIK